MPGTDADHRSLQEVRLGELGAAVERRLGQWSDRAFARRLWARDTTLWSPASGPEIPPMLGWLDLPVTMRPEVERLHAFADEVRRHAERVVVLGMGGSSLAPEVFGATVAGDGGPGLSVLDSTHPDAVCQLADALPRETVFVVSSKSGTTLETLSLFRYFWSRWPDGRHFVAITDPGTPLQALAAERAFRRCWTAPPDVGGRFSALSYFGLVPAAMAGADVGRMVARAGAMAARCGPEVAAPENPGLVLGAVLGEAARAGRDKLALATSAPLAPLASWLEQLVAESSGKAGRGLLPVFGTTPYQGKDAITVAVTAADGAGSDDHALPAEPYVRVALGDTSDLVGEMFKWEIAVAAAGAVLGIQPFDQPDVQAAKDFTARAMQRTDPGDDDGEAYLLRLPGGLDAVQGVIDAGAAGDYVAVQAFLAPTLATRTLLDRIRTAIAGRTGLPVTVGFGPRFLHSTGQLHKGGPNSGIFLQLLDQPGRRVPIPETSFSFNDVIGAQAVGDWRALRERSRRIVRVDLGARPQEALEALGAALA